jgi:oligopeptide/dipeptide ABC transporter ATP-binding protein
MSELLVVRDLSKEFTTGERGKTLKAVKNVNLTVHKGRTLGIVGESGCGKSTLGRLMIRLYEPSSGSVHFDGKDLSGLSKKDLRTERRHFQMVFQDPFASLDPRMSVEQLVEEPLVINKMMSKEERARAVAHACDRVGLPEDALSRYPHEFSGGQRQRISIARAIIMSPKLIVADEPVSALDVSIQSQVLNLFEDLKDDLHLTYVFISHDLAVIRHIADDVAVMYLGEVVEYGTNEEIFRSPQHPYTKALMSAVPEITTNTSTQRIVLEGDIPSPINPPTGCSFHTRCSFAMDVCKSIDPQLKLFPPSTSHEVACHLVNEVTL